MDGWGGCCIARNAGSGHAYSMSKMDRIMLRFRLIAPKPAAADGSFSSSDGSSSSSVEKNDLSCKDGNGKRRWAKDGNISVKRSNTRRKRKASSEDGVVNGKTASSESVSGGETAFTLPLLPETPDVKESSRRGPQSSPLWLNFGNEGKHVGYGMDDLPAALRRVVVGSWVRVECITDRWEHSDVYELGRTDEERMMNLYLDTCPGFVSDRLNRVRWTNLGYKQMVQGDGAGAEAWLVMNDGVALPVSWPSFTCRVRVVTCRLRKNPTTSLTVPCDVWRMDCGRFAWRLDKKAALSLGQ
ncbi:hypothetical protein Adt_41295 [Abeliophyllum distichum]|uniref:DUF7950 domain-containing protein n=1 Tax=Abeliophyllum distichum TaxID=126358 RepID=A0ABD1PR42_9LAMI